MYHDPSLERAASAADPRPASAVSTATGMVGLAGLLLWVGIARAVGMDGPYAALVSLAACGVPMLLWAVLVDKVHRHDSTGMDWRAAKPWRETIDTSLTKLAGLWATWAAIALIYATLRFYWQGNFVFAMWCLQTAAPALFVMSIPYMILLDRYAVDPRDGCWAFGAWLMGLGRVEDRPALHEHLRSWGVKAFFVPFMLAIVPQGFGDFIRSDIGQVLRDPVVLANWLITFMFVIDVTFATIGYILALKPLDSHIRSASPFASGWVAALICYPPFVLMAPGGALDYHPGTSQWSVWFAGHPVILSLFGIALVALTAVYAWATVAFGFRFSNLTNRGILTNGPYAWSRHPAYLSKNLFWLIAVLPFLSTGSLVDAARATILMLAVAGVYYWRAKTEERHLGLDPAYVAYSAWMERNAPVPRFFAWLRR
ncbi:methyltransferase family protein [Sphingomonas sp. PB4P5]|uniref:methyltransferase family protein n=1 Tax=Parasphingomonas puruogangriensis TaxID=3096155 RepID=UPI002FCA85BB